MGYYQIVSSELDMTDLEIIDKYHGLTCEFQSNGVPVPEERCAHSNANGVAVPF